MSTARRVPGVRTRRARQVDRRDVMVWRAIPVTTPARTLVDLAVTLDVDDLARVCHEAGIHHRTTPRRVEAVLARCPNRPGAAKLRAIMRGDAHVTLSTLERRFLGRLRDAGHRAGQLHVPQLAPWLGAGSPPRARSACAWRRVSPLQLRRHLRATGVDAGGAARCCSMTAPEPVPGWRGDPGDRMRWRLPRLEIAEGARDDTGGAIDLERLDDVDV